MADILNEIVDGLNELIKETDEKYDRFLFEGDEPRILQVINAYEQAAQEADQAAFDAPSADSGSWRGTFANAMSPNAGAQYREYMKNQPKIEDQRAKAKELQDKAQALADEIKKEYQWIVKATRGKGMPKYASLSDMIKYFKQKYSEQPLREEAGNDDLNISLDRYTTTKKSGEHYRAFLHDVPNFKMYWINYTLFADNLIFHTARVRELDPNDPEEIIIEKSVQENELPKWLIDKVRELILQHRASGKFPVQKGINEQSLNEKVYKVYHGTNNEFDKFDFKRTTQGIVWFTDSPESIQKGEHGGAGNKIIMTRYITINNPAGWEEYEKYGLQQLEDMGYDGVILPQGNKTDYFVFSNKSIKKTGPKELNEAKELEKLNTDGWNLIGKKSYTTTTGRAGLSNSIPVPGETRLYEYNNYLIEVKYIREKSGWNRNTTVFGFSNPMYDISKYDDPKEYELRFNDGNVDWQEVEQKKKIADDNFMKAVDSANVGNAVKYINNNKEDFLKHLNGYISDQEEDAKDLGKSDFKPDFGKSFLKTVSIFYPHVPELQDIFVLAKIAKSKGLNINSVDEINKILRGSKYKTFQERKKQELTETDSNIVNEDAMSDAQERYKEARAELATLDIKELKAKIKEFYAEYERQKNWNYDKADIAYTKYYVAQEFLREKEEKIFNDLLSKLIGKPFMGSTIDYITMPEMATDGKQETFYITLTDESDFEYITGKFPEFKYYNQNTGWHTQDLRNPHINPADALLTNNDLQVLTLIVKLNNTHFKRKPLPTNAVTKDGTTTYEPPVIQTQDLQWLIGQGDQNDKRKQISNVELHNETKKDRYSGGYIFLYITVGDHPLISDRYSYVVSFDTFFKPIKENLTVTYGISSDKHEVKGLDDVLYEPFIKAIKQVNPQSKLVNKISRYR